MRFFSIFPKSGSITFSELQALQAYVGALSLEDRLNLLKLNPDRADVIIPAAKIYIEVMRRCNADRILVPNVGLKDGLRYQLYEKVTGKPIQQIEFLDQIWSGYKGAYCFLKLPDLQINPPQTKKGGHLTGFCIVKYSQMASQWNMLNLRFVSAGLPG